MAAPARQPVGADGVELAAGGEDQDLVGRLRVEGELQAVAFLEGKLRIVGQVTLHRAEPALFRNHDGDRLALDHGVRDIGEVMLGR
ncbi:MAG: hypothetical protein E5W99_05535, partial [Mesorhizobium sp.]